MNYMFFYEINLVNWRNLDKNNFHQNKDYDKMNEMNEK